MYSHSEQYSIPEHIRLMEEKFTQRNLYSAVMKACGTHKLERQSVWFHVNVIDQAVWSEEVYKKYPYPLPHSEEPLATLFSRMKNFPAEQSGTTYVGLLDDRKKWLLLLTDGGYAPNSNEDKFRIQFFGAESLCKTVRSFLKQKVS